MQKIKLSGIELENFRIFQHKEKLELAPITLLVGPNNCGKTSVLKALQLFKKALSMDITLGMLNFNAVGLGKEIKDVANIYSEKNTIGLNYHFGNYSFHYPTIEKGGVVLEILENGIPAQLERIPDSASGIKAKKNDGSFIKFDTAIFYVSPIRYTVPRTVYTYDVNDWFTLILEELAKFHFTENNIAYLNKWVLRLGIADSINIQKLAELASTIKLSKNGKELELSKMGLGTQQLIPILMQIIIGQGDLILLEEPENALHPNFQTLLADIFVEAYKSFKTHFVIETHSEYLIRKLQVLVKRGEIHPEDIAIYYFADAKNLNIETRCNRITINEDGELNGIFGKGFIDEADSLAWELFRTEKKSKLLL